MLAALTTLTGCESGSRPPSSDDQLAVTSVSAAAVDHSAGDATRFPDACDHWSLTETQVEAFFALSSEVDSRIYHHDYETSRCMITGELIDNDRRWTFRINGAAKGYRSDGSTTRYFGCTASECEPLVLIPHIGMNP